MKKKKEKKTTQIRQQCMHTLYLQLYLSLESLITLTEHQKYTVNHVLGDRVRKHDIRVLKMFLIIRQKMIIKRNTLGIMQNA